MVTIKWLLTFCRHCHLKLKGLNVFNMHSNVWLSMTHCRSGKKEKETNMLDVCPKHRLFKTDTAVSVHFEDFIYLFLNY